MPPIEPASKGLATVIRDLRLQRDVTQEDLALNAGITPSNLSRIELAKANPTWTTVERIAASLDVTLQDLARAVEAAHRA